MQPHDFFATSHKINIFLEYHSVCPVVRIGTPHQCGGQISTKHQNTSIKPFFATCRLPQYPEFAKNLRSFDGFDQMSAFWSMFWFKSFRNFLRKIAIFQTFDHWSEILSLSAGRPLSQGVCPVLALSPPLLLTVRNEEIIPQTQHSIPTPPPSSCFRRPVGGGGEGGGEHGN
jgi:hypothetical protein